MKVIVREKSWKAFLAKAKRAYPCEYVNSIWGEETIDSFRITDFKRIKTDTPSPNSINYTEAELKRQKWLAQQNGKVFLGTVHTHPSKRFDTAASNIDHHEGAKDGEKVMGIVLVYRNKDTERFVIEADWWLPQNKIDFVLLSE
jgi:proteasome lid subunit RPN8/RPN11